MKYSYLIFLTIYVLSSLLETSVVDSQGTTTKKWAVRPNKGGYAKGNVAGQSYKGENAEGTVDRNNKQSQMNVQGKGTFKGGQQGKNQAVQGSNPNGNNAVADQSKKNPTNGHRSADYNGKKGNRHANLDNKKVGEDQNWDLSTKNGKKSHNVAHGKKEFESSGTRNHKQKVTPSRQDKTAGEGTIVRDGTSYKYKEQRQSNGDSNAQLSNVGKGPTKKTYTCQGQKQGVSYCVDDKGSKQGEVVCQPDRTCIVKKTIARGVEVPIAKTKAVKDPNGKYRVDVSDGLFGGNAGNYRERDCMSDYGKPAAQKIKVQKPMTVKFSSERQENGRKVFQFPDCVVVSAKVTLPAGMDIGRLAAQVDCNVLPAGKLKCVDSGACGKDCYYCDFCSNTRKATVSGNSDSSNVCQAKGGGTYQLSFTACPPPEDYNKAICSGFTKGDPTYWKKKGDIQCTLKFFLRPPNEKDLRDKFYNTVNNNQIAKQILVAEYKIKNLGATPTDYDLCQYYIKKNGPDTICSCTEGTTNYSITAKKVNTSFMIEAGALATGGTKQFFDTKQCPKVDQANQQQSQQDAQDAAKNKPAGNNWFGNFGKTGWPSGKKR